MYKLIRKKTAHSSSAQQNVQRIFFEVFVVLGMYNFGFELTIISCLVWNIINLGTKPFLDTKERSKKLLLTFKSISCFYNYIFYVLQFPAFLCQFSKDSFVFIDSLFFACLFFQETQAGKSESSVIYDTSRQGSRKA